MSGFGPQAASRDCGLSQKIGRFERESRADCRHGTVRNRQGKCWSLVCNCLWTNNHATKSCSRSLGRHSYIYPIILLPAVAPIQQFQLLRNFDAHACFIRQAKSNPKQFLAHRGIGSIVQNSKLCNVDTNKENGKSKCINCQNLQTILNQHLRTNVMMKSNGRRGN